MKMLYAIMDEFLQVEDRLMAMKTILDIVLEVCDDEHETRREMKAVLCIMRNYIESLNSDVRDGISMLDRFLAEKNGRQE